MAAKKASKKEFLKDTIQHIDITKHNVVAVVEAMKHMAFTARDLARAADIYDKMLADKDPTGACTRSTPKRATSASRPAPTTRPTSTAWRA